MIQDSNISFEALRQKLQKGLYIEDSSEVRRFFGEIIRLALVELAVLLIWAGFWWLLIYLSVVVSSSPNAGILLMASVILFVGSLVVGLRIGDNLSRASKFLRNETAPPYSSTDISASTPSGASAYIEFDSLITKCWAISLFHMILLILWGVFVLLIFTVVNNPANAISDVLRMVPEPVIESLSTTFSNLTGISIRPLSKLIQNPEVLFVNLIAFLPLLLLLILTGLNWYHAVSILVKKKFLPPGLIERDEADSDG